MRKHNNLTLLVFAGKDFCFWSEKWIGDVLFLGAFIEKIESQAVLWQYSFKRGGNAQEDHIREKYKIAECPPILLLDPKVREFARFGHLPLEVHVFAKRHSKIIEDFKMVIANCLCGLHMKQRSIAYTTKAYASALDFMKENISVSIGSIESHEYPNIRKT